jgi:hypothetical protein
MAKGETSEMRALDTVVKRLQHKTAAESSAHMNPRKAQTGATVEQEQILASRRHAAARPVVRIATTASHGRSC